MIKTKCQWCGAKIPGTPEHYNLHGNSCQECSLRVGKIVSGVRGTRKNKKGLMCSYKIRDYTEEEKQKMLMDRLKEVKLNNL